MNPTSDPASPPSMLVIMLDQMTHDVIAALGHPTVLTPGLDTLVSRGVTFTNACCPSPICVSSRASFMTGRLVRHHHAYDNGSELPAALPTVAHHLNLAGYTTILAGKMHFIGPDQHHGFQERLTPDLSPADFSLTPDWTLGPHANPGTSVNRLRYPPERPWSLQMDYDEDVLHRTLARLRQLAATRTRFFLCASFTHPHDPFLVPREIWAQYEHRAVPDPAAPPRALHAHHPYNQWIQIHHEADRFPLDADETRAARRAYYAAVTYADTLVTRLLAELERLGLDDTLVVFTSDHGEMLGEHGMWFKRTFFDPALKVPLLIARPGTHAPARRREVVSLVDLTATLLDLGGVTDPDAAPDGDSLRGLLNGEDGTTWKDQAISEYYSEGTIEPMLLLRTSRYKYVHVRGHAPLCFDLHADPAETTDVAPTLDVAVRDDLTRRLLGDLDLDELHADILRSQRERRLIAAATPRGTDWRARIDVGALPRYPRADA